MPWGFAVTCVVVEICKVVFVDLFLVDEIILLWIVQKFFNQATF